MKAPGNWNRALISSPCPIPPDDGGSVYASRLSRRSFIHESGLLTAAAALAGSLDFLTDRGWTSAARAAEPPDLVHETFHGLESFVLPASDPYSAQQGVTAPGPGGVEAGVTEVLIHDLDLVVPFLPNFSAQVAGILNGVALAVHPGITGPFSSPFANLAFPEKVTVFALMESGVIDPALPPLAAALVQVMGFLVYSEAGVFDPSSGTLSSTPVGWTLSKYGGVADGHTEFKGYFRNRRMIV